MLIEVIREKLIVANIISAFLDHMTPRIFFVGQPRLFKFSGFTPADFKVLSK